MRVLAAVLIETLFVAALCAGEPAPLRVALRTDALSAGDYMLLGEVAELSGPAADLDRARQVQIARAAQAGQCRTVYAADVLGALKQAGYLAAEMRGAAQCAVTAAAQRVEGRRLADAAAAAARASFADPDLDVDVSITSTPGDVNVRPGALELQTDLPDSGVRPGATSVRVRVLRAGVREADPVVGLSVRVSGTVSVAAERLAAGDVLTAASIKTVRRELNAVEFAARCDPQKLIGLRTRRLIMPDETIHKGVLAPPQVIRRGEAVTVVVRRGSLELAARGEARNDAALDEPVHILVQESSAEIVARATGVREATVDDPNVRSAQ